MSSYTVPVASSITHTSPLLHVSASRDWRA